MTGPRSPLPSVLFLVRKYPPEHTGDGLLVRWIARGLAGRGHRVTVVCRAVAGRAPAGDSGVDVVAVPSPARLGRHGSRVALHLATMALLSSRGRPDALVSVAGDPLLAGPGGLARLWGTTWIHRTSLLGTDDAETLSRSHAGRVLLSALRAADARIAVTTDGFRPGYLAQGFPAHRVVTLAPGIDTDRFRAADPEERRGLRADLGCPGAGPLVVFVGGIIPRKGVDLLVAAWPSVVERHRGARLVLVGPDDADPDFTARLRSDLAQGGALSTVRFVGRSDDPAPWVRAADLFVFPSRREGFGMAPLEAMAAGVPVVMTRFEGWSETLGRPGEQYLRVEPTAAGLAAAMGSLLQDPAHAGRLARSGANYVRAELSLERQVERWSRFLSQA